MKTRKLIIKVFVGLAAALVTAVGVIAAVGFTGSTEVVGMIPFIAILGGSIWLSTQLTSVCVSHGGMSVGIATILPSLAPFMMVLTSIPALVLGSVGPLFIWGLPFLVALVWGGRIAQRADSRTKAG